MNKFSQLKWQFIVSVVVANLIIIFSYWYFLNKQRAYSASITDYIDLAQIKFKNIQDWELDIQKLSKYKNLENSSDPLLEEQLIDKIHENIVQMEKPNALFQSAPKSIENIKAITASIIANQHDFKSETPDQIFKSLANEQTIINEARNNFTNEIIEVRKNQTIHKTKELDKTRIYTAIFGILSLLGIFFAFVQTLRILEYLRKNTKKEKELNSNLTKTSEELESVNWVLTNSSKLHNTISGVLSEGEIAKISLNVISDVTNAFAGAFYIRKIDSYEFSLRESHGLDPKEKIDLVRVGEGMLGAVAESKNPRILNSIDISNSRLQTGIIKAISADVVLFPVVYEDFCIAIIEIIGSFPDNKKESILNYLTRTSRSIGSALHSRQSHALVEGLLEETQRQTEELEAQQEELRITNEELVYKTNLLEASEEELRVQQEELSQANKELNEKAAELERRNNDLNHAHSIVEQKITEVEQASKYKSEFMANMSHELRTPLNSILILAKLLQDNKHSNLSEEQVKYASVIHNAGSDLLQLINELLDLAKIESGKVEIHKDSITSKHFVSNLESLFKEVAKEKSIRFNIDISKAPEQFVSDEYRLEQVLKNFLSNAFKFTDQNGEIKLHIFNQSGNLHFAVSDNGKGISEDKQALIFEAFRQEDGSTSRKYGGTGLGLSISKEISSLLGGRIILESESGKGSKFTLIIPFVENKEQGTAIVKETIANPKNPIQKAPVLESAKPQKAEEPVVEPVREIKSILIIEDDVNFADILKEFALEFGFNVMNAYDGVAGIQMAKDHIPDAIILDVMLPLADGWEVLKTLKSNESTKHIPIHMMSAANFNKKDFLESGAIGFMAKPVTGESIGKAFETIKLNVNKDLKKILLIEDQEFQSDLIKNAFAEQNINVIQAFTVESGLKKLEQEKNLDCIILDVKLPDGSGLEMLDIIKSNPKYEKLPVIINTAYDLSTEQTERIMRHTQSMVLKSSKSNNRLIDEVNLFLNKLSAPAYNPIKHPEKIGPKENYGTSTLDNKTVLIADDDMRNVFALTSSLQQYNMQIEIANNGLEALNIINDENKNIDIVLMDIMMPEMDGYEAIQEIRKNKKFNQLPIIAVTAKAMKGDREKSIELGANDYVSKPIDLDKLVSLMQVWLS
ncbi:MULTISPECIES: hybrid sensor histidine kinase/response regulator [Sphingobacterium]|uniref:histidine kinase n=1 Tax=Sphingobacterium cellulitidis TaxID=1768011 RepID=A0A8H9FXQ4_9SPHI|nr:MULTISPECIES: response regulator [Sphingobacterium]MBA8985673.1 signal transduction histidine kinase/CheY-like chemotaxis protein [Sphingobacterium soli]WFB64088.1 response regulator [Sphingobacterium sp. WM]GGE07792.1 two-component system sensor histidine kinase/response regulator [Sphingobacterium soli]